MRIQIKSGINLRTSAEQTNNIAAVTNRTIEVTAEQHSPEWYKFIIYVATSVTTVVSEPPDVDTEIPYRSQWDVDGDNRTADCGQTCVAMLAQSKGVYTEINDLRFQSSTRGVTSGVDLVKNFNSLSIPSEVKYYAKGTKPPVGAICLMEYAGLQRTSVQDRGYYGWHWVVYLSQTDTHVIVHDPNFWGTRRNEGAFKIYTIQEWNSAFKPYPNNSMLTTVCLL